MAGPRVEPAIVNMENEHAARFQKPMHMPNDLHPCRFADHQAQGAEEAGGVVERFVGEESQVCNVRTHGTDTPSWSAFSPNTFSISGERSTATEV